MGVIEGIKKIQYPLSQEDIKDVKRFYDPKRGEYSAERIYAEMYELNKAALVGAYGKETGEKYAGPFVPMPKVSITTREEKRREWLANLYTVTRSFIYQCEESPNVRSERDEDGRRHWIYHPFLQMLVSWKDIMAAQLAEYVVEEVRGDLMHRKPWSEF